MGGLTKEGILMAVDAAERFLSENHAEHESAVRVRLALEDVLLFFRERFGETAEFELRFRRRFGRLQTALTTGSSLAALSGEMDVLKRRFGREIW